MDDALAVRGGETAGERDAELESALGRDWLGELREALPANVLGDDERPPVVLAEPVHRDDVRVLQPRRRPRLEREPLARALVEMRDELDRDEPIEHAIVGEPHAAHAALPERPHELVLVELGRRRRGLTRRNPRDGREQQVHLVGAVAIHGLE